MVITFTGLKVKGAMSPMTHAQANENKLENVGLACVAAGPRTRLNYLYSPTAN